MMILGTNQRNYTTKLLFVIFLCGTLCYHLQKFNNNNNNGYDNITNSNSNNMLQITTHQEQFQQQKNHHDESMTENVNEKTMNKNKRRRINEKISSDSITSGDDDNSNSNNTNYQQQRQRQRRLSEENIPINLHDPKTVILKQQPKVNTLLNHQYILPDVVDHYAARAVSNDAMYSSLLNVNEHLVIDNSNYVPFFLHLPKSGGSSLKLSMACMSRTITVPDIPNCTALPEDDNPLRICHWTWQGYGVNVDLSSPGGVMRAAKLKLVEQNYPNIVLTVMQFTYAQTLFGQSYKHKGRLFLMLRDPVERSISFYHYVIHATHEWNYKPEWKDMSMKEFYTVHWYDNFVIRILLGIREKNVNWNDHHLNVAKEILRQKALVLLTNQFEESVSRMAKYFGWSPQYYPFDANGQVCYNEIKHTNANPNRPTLNDEFKSSDDYKFLLEYNKYDMLLYEYASEVLFEHQSQLFM